MANITKRRTGEFLRILCEILWDQPDGVPAKDIITAIGEKTTLTEYELGHYDSSPNYHRYDRIVRFATIDMVKAGWLFKSKGRWYLTDEGRTAYKKYNDPEEFYDQGRKLYREWKLSRKKEDLELEEVDSVELEAEKTAFTFEEAEEKSWEQIQEYLQTMNPYEFQNLVADLLEAMSYHVSWISPPGKDRGVDIIAYTDPLGASNPRIKVQVKRRENPVSVDGLRSFLSVLGSDDLGLFVSTGGFTRDAHDEARTQERRKITLLDLQNLFDLWVEHYDNLTQEARQRLPLKPIYFLSLDE